MQTLLRWCKAIDRLTAVLGRGVAWLILVAVLVSAGNAIIRKTMGMSSNAWLELQWYLYGAVFMLAAAWTLQKNEHVRIDVVSAHLGARTKLWIDLFCHILFLLPFAVLMSWLAWPFFLRSIKSGEVSMNAGGLILWPAKAVVFAGFAVLLLQALSEIGKTIGRLSGDLPMPDEGDDDKLPPEIREHEHMDSELGTHDRA